MMRNENCDLFADIDDLILVSNIDDAEHHFYRLASLIEEFGLPMNPDKFSHPLPLLRV